MNGSFVIIAAYAEGNEANAALSRLQEGIAAFLAAGATFLVRVCLESPMP